MLEGPSLAALLNNADKTENEEAPPSTTTTTKASKKRPRASEDDVAALQKQLKQLKSENKKLKKQAKRKAKTPAADDAADDNVTTEMASAASPVAANAHLDMSAWDAYNLHPGIMRALQQCGFTAPTAIQAACLVPAIEGRCDVIGAAQTVWWR